MPLIFADAGHAGMRLSRSILRYKGHPILLGDVRDNYSCSFTYLMTGRESTIKDVRDCPEVSFEPVPLGFCQVGGYARYLMRKPRRRYKQGLNEESLYAEGPQLPSLSNEEFRKSLGRAIRGRHMSITDAIAAVEKETFVSAPFHRDWAVYKEGDDLFVLYRYYGAVGKIVDGNVVINSNYQYLQETYDGDMADE